MRKINLSGLKKYTIMFILLGLMVVFSFTSPYFLTIRNLTNIITQNTYFIIAAVGLSFVMIGGGIDLSVGWQMSLVGIVTAILMVEFHVPAWLGVTIGLLLGTCLGLFNGVIVTNVHVFPLIVTIATSTVFQGISYIISQSQTFRNYPAEFLFIAKGKVLGVPFDVILAIVVVLFATFVYSKTKYGWNVMALGGNEEASRLAGIKTRMMKTSVYALCGFFRCGGNHGDDLQGEYHQLRVWSGYRVHDPDRSHHRWDQLHGRGGEYGRPGGRRVCPGRAGEWYAAGGLEHICAVYCKRHHPARCSGI